MKTALIIGAGPAGLTAAYELLKKTDIRPIILEQSGCVGGISRTVEYKGNHMDIGGHRFFTKNAYINSLWRELCPDIMRRPRKSRIFYLGKFFDYPISIKYQTVKNLGLLRTIQIMLGYLKSVVFKRTESNLENYMINHFGEPLYKMFFENYTEKVWGRHPREIDASWGRQRVRGLSVFRLIANALRIVPFEDATLIEEFLYPKHGPGELFSNLAARVTAMGGEIIYGAKVDKITVSQGKITGIRAGSAHYCADYYFSSMAVKDFALSATKIPQDVADIAANLPYRDFITIGLLCSKFAMEYPQDNWIYVQEPGVKLGRLQIFNNWSPYMVKEPSTVWLGLEYFVDKGDELWEMDKETFTALALGELEKIGLVNRRDVLDSIHIRMEKAYPAYFGTYSQFPLVEKWLRSIGNLYCIGRNGQHRYNNMDHSMLTAVAAVDGLINGENNGACWGVNVEEGYHEER